MNFDEEVRLSRIRVAPEFALFGLKTLTLVNGAAAISLLTFVGNAKLETQQQSQIGWALVLFASGVGLAMLAIILGYQAAKNEAWGKPRAPDLEPLASEVYRKLALGAASASLIVFAGGIFVAAGAFIS